jgi:hypothetical protein
LLANSEGRLETAVACDGGCNGRMFFVMTSVKR